ncbi:uncharacterized protein FOMMEDRAFT_153571 [Fomitiporia mediterranea MF3/22]|uniref:uncharacterized protein n=1 Tax=Fomitiporia mediterranea (strain MF3/22) TaxID=694068 RepID=UPI00044091A1|nr:uncharacterized protein FOMMEDRAFT_153571 [Fomitiporia mediterranea MF3/22]EJD06173.1 hypothetical protein FOMMEDRAFT_153571 [Fomitiporia mediterranea MF3/22]
MEVNFGPGPVYLSCDNPTSRVGVSISSTPDTTKFTSTSHALSSISDSSGTLGHSSPQASPNTPTPTIPLTISSMVPTTIPLTSQILGIGQTSVASTTITGSSSFTKPSSSTTGSSGMVATLSGVDASYTSGLPTVTLPASGSDPHSILNKGQIISVSVGIGATVAVISVFVFYIFRRVRASRRISTAGQPNPTRTHGPISGTRNMIEPYNVGEHVRTSWDEDVATLRKFNMTGS